MKYVAKAQLSNEQLGVSVMPGDEVPEAMVKMSPWLLEEQLVVTSKQHAAEQAAQKAQEDAVAAAPDQDDPSASNDAYTGA